MMTKLSWLKEYGRTIVAQPGTLDFDEFRILVATKIVPAVVRVRVFVINICARMHAYAACGCMRAIQGSVLHAGVCLVRQQAHG